MVHVALLCLRETLTARGGSGLRVVIRGPREAEHLRAPKRAGPRHARRRELAPARIHMIAAVGLGILRQESIVVILIQCRAVSRIRVLGKEAAGVRVSRNDGFVEQLNHLGVRIRHAMQISVRVEPQ